jgi:hypothetical protein
MKRRRNGDRPFAAYAALAFNAGLVGLSVTAADAVRSAYVADSPFFEATPEAISATRDAIDERFNRLALNGEGPPRDVWSRYVQDRLEAGDVTTARGFILAAPAMLSAGDVRVLEARINVSEGADEQAVVEAALAYLPDDVQDTFERLSAPAPDFSLADAASPELAGDDVSGGLPEAGEPVATAGPVAFSVLGDLRDLSLTAAQWVRNEMIVPLDETAFTLSGASLIFADEAVRNGASIVLGARRAGRLDPDFEAYLAERLFDAIPPQRLKRMLRKEFRSDFGYSADSTLIEQAFRNSADPAGLGPVFSDLRTISEMSSGLSPGAAISILGTVRDGSDLRRARLVAQAGGERAVALAQHSGDDFLNAARTAIRWTDALRASLFTAGALASFLCLMALTVLWMSFRRHASPRRSAIYALDDAYWP